MTNQRPMKPHHIEWLKTDWVEALGVQPQTRQQINKQRLSVRKWYTYVLWRVDLGEPVPFYIGKGTASRILQHSAPSDNINQRKHNIFQIHADMGLDVLYSYVDSFDDEQDALDDEITLVTLLGRTELEAGPLSNRTSGGDGTTGHIAKRGEDNATSRAVMAEGVRYGTLTEAAEFYSVSGGAIAQRIMKGWRSFFYEDEGQRPEKEGLLGRYKREVTTPEGMFPSLSDAGRATGINFKTIHKHIVFGWDGYFYTDEGQRPRITNLKRVMVDGVKFESQKEAAEAYGVNTGSFNKRLRSSNFPNYVDLSGTIPKIQKNKPFGQRLWIDDVEYRNCGVASRALDIKSETVFFRLKSSNFPNYVGEGVKKVQRDPSLAKAAVSVTIDGVSYPTLSSAAKALGTDINTIKTRCKSMSFSGYLSDDPTLTKRPAKDGKASLLRVSIDDVVYRSVNAAHVATGVGRAVIRKRLDDIDWPSYKVV